AVWIAFSPVVGLDYQISGSLDRDNLRSLSSGKRDRAGLRCIVRARRGSAAGRGIDVGRRLATGRGERQSKYRIGRPRIAFGDRCIADRHAWPWIVVCDGSDRLAAAEGSIYGA